MNKLFMTILAAVALVLVSCSNNNSNDYTSTTRFSDCFQSITAKNGTTTISDTNVSYTVEINFTENTANVLISGLKLADGTGTPDIKLKDLKVTPPTNEDKWYTISAPTTIPAGTGGRIPSIDNFQTKLLLGFTNSYSYVVIGFYTTFVMDNDYSVFSAWNNCTLGGTTTTTGAGQPFETKNTTYRFQLNPAKQCMDITLTNAQFMSNMPAMNFVLKEIPFTINGKTVSFNAESLVPYIGETPNEGFPISNLSGILDFSRGMTLNFRCSPKTVEGVTFHTTASGNFLDIFGQN